MAGVKLNKEQLEAVKHKEGPLLIIAGAGTGKTTVITERIKYLILSKKVKTSEILALTFTEKAAREMEERVDVVMPYGYTSMWISTFHSFCDRILRQEALHIGLDPRYKLMPEAESTQFVRNNLFKFDLKYFRPLGNPTKFVGGMLQHFSRLQDEDITPSDYWKWVSAKKKQRLDKEENLEVKKWQELASAYRAYDELKVKDSVMDFGDLIVKTLALFRQRGNVLKQYQKQFRYVLVDEFQDTNFAQNELAILLSGKDENITVTGDDDQSIYRFRGAAVSNIIQFRKHFPKTKVVTLVKNYRSTQDILDKSYSLIKHNNPDRLEVVENIDKKLIAQKESDDGEILFFHTDRVENEADLVSKKISSLVKSGNYKHKDFAILVRANNHFEPFGRSLARYSIPYQFLGPGRLFKQPEIIDLISYLKVLYNFEDSVALFRVLSNDHFDISARDLAKIGNYARKYNLSLFEACEKVDDVYVETKTKSKIKKILKIIEKHLKLIQRETAGQLLYYFLEETGMLKNLLSPDNPEAEKAAKNVSKLFDKLKTYEVNHENATVIAVVDWLELSSELGESPLATDTDWMDVDAVNILTAHSSKGLEFPAVFLVNLVSQRFPTIQRREQIPIPDELVKEVLPVGDYHVQEERRLFYVGMTRAINKLFFTASDYYGEGKREKKLSPFIFEALGDDVVASEQNGNEKQLSFLDFSTTKDVSVKRGVHPIHVDFLSYSQIQTFKICPLHYKLAYILKVPTLPLPALSFGSAIHSVMNDFYKEVKMGCKPTNKLFYSLLKDNWISEGYTSKSHEKEMFERGKRYLSNYLKNDFDPKNIPILLEQPFIVPLSSKKGERRLKIGGKIDRVDKLEKDMIEIIDYKTGERVPTQKEVDNDLQLTFYALSATRIKDAPLNKKPKDVKLSLYFFEEKKKVSTKRTAKQLKESEKEIFEWRRKIEESDFKCSNHFFCNNCEYKLMCKSD